MIWKNINEVKNMPIVTTKEMFQKAYEGGYAIGAGSLTVE